MVPSHRTVPRYTSSNSAGAREVLGARGRHGVLTLVQPTRGTGWGPPPSHLLPSFSSGSESRTRTRFLCPSSDQNRPLHLPECTSVSLRFIQLLDTLPPTHTHTHPSPLWLFPLQQLLEKQQQVCVLIHLQHLLRNTTMKPAHCHHHHHGCSRLSGCLRFTPSPSSSSSLLLPPSSFLFPPPPLRPSTPPPPLPLHLFLLCLQA